MNIVFSSDNNYAPLLGIALYSFRKTNMHFIETVESLRIFVLEIGISEQHKGEIRAIFYGTKCVVEFINMKEVNTYLENSIKFSVRSLATWYRIFLPSILPTNVNKVLYLDCDVLVMQSLEDLWKIEIDDFDIAGVLDLVAVENKIKVGLSVEDSYVNAGVLLINLKRWRESKIQDKFLEFVDERDGIVTYHDQGAINGVCKAKKVIHPKFNSMTPFHLLSGKNLRHYHDIQGYYTDNDILDAASEAVICHLTPYFVDRPWVKGNLHPLRFKYLKIQSETPWAEYRRLEKSRTVDVWVKWAFWIFPYFVFIAILRFAQWFKIKTWIYNSFYGRKKL